MRYVVAPTHEHWHYMHFDRYTLRRVGGGAPVRRDVKSGFCLGDRYAAPDMPAADPSYTSNCGPRQPGRKRVTEGISVGFGDDYVANLEGQWLPLDGLRRGRYLLVHRANADGRLRERTLDNNAASVLFRLRWRHKQPVAKILATCPAGEVRCAMSGSRC
jgi:hypothetical protein